MRFAEQFFISTIFGPFNAISFEKPRTKRRSSTTKIMLSGVPFVFLAFYGFKVQCRIWPNKKVIKAYLGE